MIGTRKIYEVFNKKITVKIFFIVDEKNVIIQSSLQINNLLQISINIL